MDGPYSTGSRVTVMVRRPLLWVVGSLLVSGVMLGVAGCGDNKFQEAYETAKTLSSNGDLTDTQAIKYYGTSQELLRQIAGLKIKAERRNLYVLRQLLGHYEDLEMWSQVVETADKLVGLQPTNKEWYIRKGRAHIQLSTVDSSHHEPAERAFRAALEIDPNSLKAHYGLGVLYGFHMDEGAKARRHLRKAAYETKVTVKNRPEVVDARFALGKFEYETGNLSAARKAFQSILGMESLTSESKFLAQKNLGDVYRRMGSTELAKQHYHQAYNINPVNSSVRDRLRSLGVEIEDRFNRFERLQ